jgi:hypothetical protein
LAYSEAVRAIEEQQTALDNVRNRGATIVATGGISSSFLASATLEGQTGIPGWALAAMLAGLAALLLAILVLLPWSWFFTNDPYQLANDEWAAMEEDEVLRTIARYTADNIAVNNAKLKWLWICVEVGIGALGASIFLWFIALTRR